MPIQKGKRRRRQRRQGPRSEAFDATEPAPAQATPVTRRGKTRRRGFQPPLWVNLALGVVMVLFGLYFFAIPFKGVGMGQRLLFLLLYFAVAGLYLGKALRQWRANRTS